MTQNFTPNDAKIFRGVSRKISHGFAPRTVGARGFTLIEVLVYIGLFTLVVTLVTFFLLGLFRSFIVLRAERSAVLNSALVMQVAELELRHADRVYTSTSVFDNDAGQLSVRTPRSSPTDHDFAYVDFYLDNGVIYERRDGASPSALTSGDVTVSVFRVERYTSSGAEGIRFTVTAAPANVAVSLAAPRTLRTFVSLRGFTP